MPEIVTWQFVRNSITLFLLLFSSLIATQPVTAQFCGSHTGDLYDLPACAFLLNSGKFIDYAYLTSVEPQTIIASPGQNLSFAIGYQIWRPTVLPSICTNEGIVCTFQLLFIASWIQWPPKTFWSLTEVVPSPGPPGTTGSISFHLTAPVETGTYYMWFCVNAAHQGATGWAAEPTPPGHIKLIVSTLGSTVTVTSKITGAVASSPLSVALVPIGVGGVIVAVALASTVLVVGRRRRRGSAAEASFASLDELLLSVDQQVVKESRVFATVMFTDIVGSTEWAAKLGDHEWQGLLNRHFDLIRRELDLFHGREVGTTGDGMLAVFADPERAVRCACSVRDVVRSLALELRIGLHTGEVQFTKKAGLDHVAGIAVHIGARVASQAGPGEILVSSTTKDLITGSGIQFKDYGTRTLKGVPGEWHLFAVTAA